MKTSIKNADKISRTSSFHLFYFCLVTVAGLTNRNQQPSTLIFINMVYLELPINLMCMLMECWRKYLERTLTGKDNNMQTPNPPIYMS